MDNRNQKPTVHDQRPVRQAVTTPVPKPAIPSSDNNPKLDISAEQAQALLAINDLQSSHAHHKNPKLPIGLLITLATVVAIVIIASILLSGLKSRTDSNKPSSSSGESNSSSSNTNNNSASSQTDNQINQDVNSCSNPVTAVSQC